MSDQGNTEQRKSGLTEAQMSQLVDSMCLTWRHDFNIVKIPEPSGAWLKGPGMADVERDNLRRNMRQLVENNIVPLLAELRPLSISKPADEPVSVPNTDQADIDRISTQALFNRWVGDRSVAGISVTEVFFAARGIPARRIAPPAGVNFSSILTRLHIAEIASCSCLTKTPDYQYHSEDCRYRILSEAAAVIEATGWAKPALSGGEAKPEANIE